MNEVALAKDLFQGRLVRMVQKLCEQRGYDYRILSLKYGLLDPQEEVKPYKTKFGGSFGSEFVRNKIISDVREKTIPKLSKILPNYDRVIVVAGEIYKNILEPVWNDKFEIIESQGYGYLLSILRRMIDQS